MNQEDFTNKPTALTGLFFSNIMQIMQLPLKYYDHWSSNYINKYSEILSNWYVLEVTFNAAWAE